MILKRKMHLSYEFLIYIVILFPFPSSEFKKET